MTRKRVADEQYGSLSRRLGEVARRVDEGSVPLEPAMSALQRIVEGVFSEGGTSAPTFARDMTKEGWTLLEDTGEPNAISVASLELVSFLKKGEFSISGEEIVKRAKRLRATLGQRHAEHLLEHQEEIPEEFRDFYLIFPGTIWRDRHGDRRVPYLYGGGRPWYLDFTWLWLAYDWVSSARLVRPST